MKFRTSVAAALGVLALAPVGRAPAGEVYDTAGYCWVSDAARQGVNPNGAAPATQSFGNEQCASGGNEQCGSGVQTRGACRRWTAQADVLYMQRRGAPEVTLISTVAPPARELTNATEFNLQWEGGPRLSLRTCVIGGNDLELLYYSIDGWWDSQMQSVPTGVKFTAPDFQAFAFGTSGMKFDWTSKLYNAEVNLWTPAYRRVRVMAGFRWMETRESLIGAFVSPGGVTPFWSSKTDNHLYGFQIGADARVWKCRGPFYVTATVKAGIYTNHAEQRGSAVGETLEAEDNQPAFEGEATLMGVYQCSRSLALRLGYQAMWLQGVAMAPGQIHVTNFTTHAASVDNDGAVFYHGAVAGLELKF